MSTDHDSTWQVFEILTWSFGALLGFSIRGLPHAVSTAPSATESLRLSHVKLTLGIEFSLRYPSQLHSQKMTPLSLKVPCYCPGLRSQFRTDNLPLYETVGSSLLDLNLHALVDFRDQAGRHTSFSSFVPRINPLHPTSLFCKHGNHPKVSLHSSPG